MRGQTALEYVATQAWAIFLILSVAAILWYYGVFDPARYAAEVRLCPSNLKIIQSPLSVTDPATGTGTLSLLVANVAGHGIFIDNVTLTGDASGSLGSGGGSLKAGDSTTLVINVSGLVGQTGTRISVDAHISFTHLTSRLANVSDSVACTLKLKMP